MTVKIIQAENVYDLERAINKYLISIDNNEILDIKYQSVGKHGLYDTDGPSAMIIMR